MKTDKIQKKLTRIKIKPFAHRGHREKKRVSQSENKNILIFKLLSLLKNAVKKSSCEIHFH
ncbi:hypothetical protein Ilyop_2156 (plasmid) [Ilyobacter polytropus DSM 2926]|uniref:Uncharacterized protein n=1 Tax=Ilyobacter polytropus (strain ATCC 51220 / DSM 2926 / LMG 16218 / CuHBu1) TaxID=572544 RepID=E3HC76_ILYPC|nr:hypothetical protein Ilyop_2156 [Ilyobacter polytropus DSM 2926]